VQSAFIGAETQRKDALAFAQVTVPQAHAAAEALVQAARADASLALARARGEAAAFLDLAREHGANPLVTRERLYRDAVERALRAAGSVRWVPPPPAGGRYQGLRISIDPATAGVPGDSEGGEGP
jgi:regulator of protease activity HflC (stomatin/prohibitin superfamily)